MKRVVIGGREFWDLGTHMVPAASAQSLQAGRTGTVELSPYWATRVAPATSNRDTVEIRSAGPTGLWWGHDASVRPATGTWLPAGETVSIGTSDEVWACCAELIPNGGFEEIGGAQSGGPNGWAAGWYGSQFDPALIPAGLASFPGGLLFGAARTSAPTNPLFHMHARPEFAATKPELPSRFAWLPAVYQSAVSGPPPAQGARLVSAAFPLPDGASTVDIVGWWHGADGRGLGTSCSLGIALSSSPDSAVVSTPQVLALAASPGSPANLGTRFVRLEYSPWSLGGWTLVRTRIPITVGYATGAAARWARLHLYQDRWISDTPAGTDLDQSTCWDAIHVPSIVTWRELSFSQRG